MGEYEKGYIVYVCLKCGNVYDSNKEFCKCGWCESQEKAKN